MMNHKPRRRATIGAWTALSTLAMGCVGVWQPGCGGSSSSAVGGAEDGGPDAMATTDGSTTSPGKDASEDSTTPGSDSGEDSSAAASPDAATPDSGPDGQAQTGPDAASEAGAPACTGSETACAVGSSAGLCVSGTCAICNSPADNANCTTAYGGGSTSYVCDSAGSCVAGNCNADADCSGANAGEICGLTTASLCGHCTGDAQCQSDPTYGPTTICNTGTGACVAAACTTNSAACAANAADVCCGLTCVPGGCCANTDCATSTAGGICGASTPNVCGKCTADTQCAAGQVCKTSTGQCLTNAGLCTGAPGGTGGAAGTCMNIGTDVCCNGGTCFAQPAGGGVACCPGTAGTTYCQTQLNNTSATCAGNVCTTCAGVSTMTPIYYVDPVNGSDSGTGSLTLSGGGAAASCALKTITRALQLIGTAVVPTQIVVVGGASATVSAGETFPIKVPTNVTISTQTGPVTVNVPNGKAGFAMSAPNAQITSGSGAMLTITTTVTGTAGGTDGIVVGTGSDASTQISNVTVTGMVDSGILVNGGALTLGQGVVASSNGVGNKAGHGLSVQGGEAIVDVPSGSPPTKFDDNTAHGILVGGTGFIHLTGSVISATAGTGTVVTNGNTAAGVWIQQTAAAPAQNVINGLVSFANAGGNGMRIVGGSSVQLRSSVLLGNGANGVIVSTGTGATANSLANIDLGTGASSGGNTFQAPLGSGNNANAGLCLAVAANSGTLDAAGDTFHAATCTSGTPTLTLNTKGCGNNAAMCAGGVCDLGETAATGNVFNVATCTP
jgi:hypothetical protein